MRFVVADNPVRAADGFSLIPERNLVTGRAEFERGLGQALSGVEADLLLLATAIYATDLAYTRQRLEGFVRNIQLQVPVVNPQTFRLLSGSIAHILYLLSSDNWELEFVQSDQEGPNHTPAAAQQGKTLLFSGGLDSLAAAIEELEIGSRLYLASHYTRNPVLQTSQRELHDYLRERYHNLVGRAAVRAGGQNSRGLTFPKDADREPTQRTRSFLFLTIAAIAAVRTGYREILMIAENGQMAIHVPLTAARLGGFSTHTAHPEVLSEMENLLTQVLSCQLTILNPFLYRTKAECISPLMAQHREIIRHAVSCWRSSRQAASHCGQCVPCIVRRIAVEANGLTLAEYQVDLFMQDIGDLPEDSDGKRNLVEMAEFVSWFGGNYSDAELEAEFPDLFNAHIDRPQAIAMYRRFSAEALRIWSRYPGVAGIL